MFIAYCSLHGIFPGVGIYPWTVCRSDPTSVLEACDRRYHLGLGAGQLVLTRSGAGQLRLTRVGAGQLLLTHASPTLSRASTSQPALSRAGAGQLALSHAGAG
uniref:Uncharacterized protein n=1 Tax=Asparagus officinalis TaxID=4686 RepID=Q2XNT6_ASPOF|nr:hypothetical protein 12.t00056 [Asparagus officinalis]